MARPDLKTLVNLSRDASERFTVRPSPPTEGAWVSWVPATWEAQAELMWKDSAEALAVVRFGLSKRLIASAIGSVRFVLEAHTWLTWLLQDEAARPARAFGRALKEVEDWANTLKNESTNPQMRAEFHYLAEPKREQIEVLAATRRRIQERAKGAGIQPARVPKSVQAPWGRLFQDQIVHRFFSDLGSHPGFGLHYLLDPSIGKEKAMGELLRAFALGLACEIHLQSVELAAHALGRHGVIDQLTVYRGAHQAAINAAIVYDAASLRPS